MIEKKIHYVWLGHGEKDNLVHSCIQSWKQNMPDYEVIEWNESNLDMKGIFSQFPFIEEAYKRRLWAYVSDYVRLKVLDQHGGIYIDTDFSLLKNISPIIDDCDMFMGRECPKLINGAIMGSVKGHPFIKELIDFYEHKFISYELFTIPDVITHVYQTSEHQDQIKILPKECFYPYHFTEKFFPECVSENTYGIHWWGFSWGDNPNLAFIETKHLTGINKQIAYHNSYLRKFVKRNLRLAKAFF